MRPAARPPTLERTSETLHACIAESCSCTTVRSLCRRAIENLRATMASALPSGPFRTNSILLCSEWFKRIFKSKSRNCARSDSCVVIAGSLRSLQQPAEQIGPSEAGCPSLSALTAKDGNRYRQPVATRVRFSSNVFATHSRPNPTPNSPHLHSSSPTPPRLGRLPHPLSRP